MTEANPLRDALKILQAAGLHDQGLELAIKHTKNLTTEPVAPAAGSGAANRDYLNHEELLALTEEDIKAIKKSDPAKYRRSLEQLGVSR